MLNDLHREDVEVVGSSFCVCVSRMPFSCPCRLWRIEDMRCRRNLRIYCLQVARK